LQRLKADNKSTLASFCYFLADMAVGVWILASCSNASKAMKKPLFCLGKSIKSKVWGSMFLVLSGGRDEEEIGTARWQQNQAFFRTFWGRRSTVARHQVVWPLFIFFCPGLNKTSSFWNKTNHFDQDAPFYLNEMTSFW